MGVFGSHTFYIRAVDSAGNAGSAASITFDIDTTTATMLPMAAFTANKTSVETGETITFTTSQPTARRHGRGTLVTMRQWIAYRKTPHMLMSALAHTPLSLQ